MNLAPLSGYRRWRFSTAWRIAVATAVLGSGTWLGAAVSLPSRAGAAHELCRVSAVDVMTHNKTDVTLKKGEVLLGGTNAWCRYPDKQLGPGSVSVSESGDNLFATEVYITYIAPNGDKIILYATSGYVLLKSAEAVCGVEKTGTAPHPYSCSASVHVDVLDRGAPLGLGTRVALVDWNIERH